LQKGLFPRILSYYNYMCWRSSIAIKIKHVVKIFDP